MLSGRTLDLIPTMVLFAAFGLFHGSAFGDSIAAQESGVGAAVLAGYLIGLGVIQYAIARASGWAVRTIWKATDPAAIQPRLVGATIAGIGVFLTLETFEGFVFSALGIAG